MTQKKEDNEGEKRIPTKKKSTKKNLKKQPSNYPNVSNNYPNERRYTYDIR